MDPSDWQMGGGGFTIMPILEAYLLGSDDSSADEDGNNEEDGDTDDLNSEVL